MSNSFTVTLEIHECLTCGVPYGLTPEYRKRRQQDHKNFKCPNGHTQYYPGKNKEEKLRADLNSMKGQRDQAEQCCSRKTEDIKYFQRVAAANKGVVTRMKNQRLKQNESNHNPSTHRDVEFVQ